MKFRRDRTRGPSRATVTAIVATVGVVVAGSFWSQVYLSSRISQHNVPAGKNQKKPRDAGGAQQQHHEAVIVPRQDRCAICLYGLPRAFDSLVMPSLKGNVIQVNAHHGCDYFVHYYNQTDEQGGRSGSGGTIHPDEIRKLEAEVEWTTEMYGGPPRRPVTLFASETPDDFWKKRGPLVEKVRTVKDSEGRYLYYPWKAMTYRHPHTTDNILKMWHSIQGSWELMQSHAAQAGIDYNRVAMLRSDVVYATPIDVWQKPSTGQKDYDNHVAVIPGFSKHPISDRLVYGPSRAVAIWAAQRFDRMEDHVRWTLANDPGWGLHSERFVMRALLEPIKKLGYDVEEHPTMCFLRARADESVWTDDCDARFSLPSISNALGTNVRERVETVIGRKCHGVNKQRQPKVLALNCSRPGAPGG
jgi:hypothetical protein